MTKYPKLFDREWLTNELKIKSMHLIAQEVGCSYSAVLHSRNKHGIVVEGKEPRSRRRNYDMSAVMKAAYKKKYPSGRFGSIASNWRGGRRRVGTKGAYIYAYAPEHPNAKDGGYVMEHRLVMEKSLGRLLTATEVVHHKNGDKKDNKIENLELVESRGAHTREHFERSHVTEIAELKAKQLEDALRAIDPNHPLLVVDKPQPL